MGETMIKTCDLCKEYKGTKAVSHLNMLIQKGDIYGFIGKMGQENQRR